MSAAIDAFNQQAVLLIQATGHRRIFMILSAPLTGQTFAGTLRTEGTIDPGMELGSDIREKCVLDVLRDAPVMESQTRIEEGYYGPGGSWVGEQVWMATAREDNTADVEASYDLVKVIDGVDA